MKTNPTMVDIDWALTLARAFSEGLKVSLSYQQFTAVLDRNAAEDSDLVCHSHDFLDANMVMADAFEEVFARSPDVDDEKDVDLWNAAWSIAKAAKFFVA